MRAALSACRCVCVKVLWIGVRTSRRESFLPKLWARNRTAGPELRGEISQNHSSHSARVITWGLFKISQGTRFVSDLIPNNDNLKRSRLLQPLNQVLQVTTAENWLKMLIYMSNHVKGGWGMNRNHRIIRDLISHFSKSEWNWTEHFWIPVQTEQGWKPSNVTAAFLFISNEPIDFHSWLDPSPRII